MATLTIGWQNWVDGKPVDSDMGLLADNFRPKLRRELGDMDDSEWELDKDGKKKDPWQFTNMVVCRVIDGDTFFTFVTSSKGGVQAVGNLCNDYAKGRAKNNGKLPVVTFERGHYKHDEYGRIYFPKLVVEGWSAKWAGLEHDAPVAEDDAPEVEEVDDEEVPF